MKFRFQALKIFILWQLIFFHSSVYGQFVSATIGVDGLTCSSCSFGVEQALRKLDFVKDVKTDLNAATAEISFVSGKKISIDDLAKKVSQAGFSIRFVKAVYSFQHSRTVMNDTLILEGDVYCLIRQPESQMNGNVSLQFIGEKYLDKKSFRQWQPQITEARLKHPMLRPDTYFVLL
ncbi:MAG: heavy-metal-associated domain-containing protein [Chitinophagales bacterium]